MSWLKIDDQIANHQKILQVGPAAAWLWICSIAYAQNHLTDGFVPDNAVGHMGVLKDVKHLSSRLVKAELWERVKGGFQVHDYLHHNASAAERKAELTAKADAGRKGGRRSGQVRRAKRDSYTKQPAGDSFKQNRSTSRSRAEAPGGPHSTPLHSDVQAAAPAARTAGVSTTSGNGSDQPRRNASDGGPSAPASASVEPPTATTVEEAQAEYERDPHAYNLKYRRQR